MLKKIIHIDLDCYYAAVEMRDYPELRDIPLAIGDWWLPESAWCDLNM
ncbi:protein of unknown function [Vibrio tapetis subsp. tapetis]|uniref:UmuC domain-containing protein n=1 Tax=Vibrio tapetis subsp. tapetis TaxID=1671868 RepID=A0A2N8ZEC8_9VIBR|nr:protein of unknown function [Vibrio tapetis subsp. tapetis]